MHDESAPPPLYARYKNKVYLLKFLGRTRFGERAKLAFLNDNSKEFWVSAREVTVCKTPTPPKRKCLNCPADLNQDPQAKDGYCSQCLDSMF